jgi:hypothetical protein
MTKYSRHQSVILRNTDEYVSEDHWLKQFEKKLEKAAVQPRSKDSLYDQINSIMNGSKTKYPSVQAAVDEMMHRSGLTNYLKISKDKEETTKKVAADENNDFDKQVPVEKKQEDTNTPDAIRENPAILRTIENYIRSTRGNLPVPAIIDKVHYIHQSDVSDEKVWEDDKLIRLVSKLNLEAKKNNPSSYQDFYNLAIGNHDTSDSEVDLSNTDAFNALMPAKL